MRRITHFISMTVCVISVQLSAQNKQDEIVAIWNTGETKIEIYKAGDKYLGNPINAEGQRNEQIEVLNLVHKEGIWVGKIYSKKRGRLLDVVCEVSGDKLLLEVRARLITRNLQWSRTKG